MSDASTPQPGWYADPENPAGERWWNGSGWSDHKRDSTEAAAASASAASFTVAPLAPTLGSPAPGSPPPAYVPPASAPPSYAAPASVPAPPAPVADSAGFTFGAPGPAAADPRPDPYAPPAQGYAQPYYSSPYVGAPYGAPAYGSSINGLALAGLIVSTAGWLVLSILGPIAGIILSAFGLRAARQREMAGNPNSGRGLAMAGLIVGIIILAIAAIALIAFFGAMMTTYRY